MTRKIARSGMVLLALLATAALVVVPELMAQTSSDYDYATTIDITVATSIGDQDNLAVRAAINASNLVDNGLLGSDGQDILVLTSGGTEVRPLAQFDGNGSTWWLPVTDTITAGETVRYVLYTGQNTTGADNPQHLFLSGASEFVDVLDTSTLDITTNLTIRADNLRMVTLPASTGYVLRKLDAYELSVHTAGIQVRILDNGTKTAPAQRPNAAGTSAAFTATGCAANWQCVDEVSADGDTTYVASVGAAANDYYALGASTIPADAKIESIDVAFRARHESCSCSGTAIGGLRLNGTDQLGSGTNPSNTYATFTETIDRPGGGSWAVGDLEDLEVIVRANDGATPIRITQAWVTVTYTDAMSATWSTPSVDTEYDVRATYDGSTLALLVDDTTQATDSGSITIATNASTVTIGEAGFIGWIDRVRVGDTNVASPTYRLDLQFEPDQVHQTQEGTSGNGWTWKSRVQDQSGEDNDGTYEAVRDTTGITVTVNSTLPRSASVSTTSASETGPTVATGSVNDPFGDAFAESGSLAWPLNIIDVATSDIPTALLAYTLGMLLGIAGGFGAYRLSGRMPAFGIIGGVLTAGVVIYMSPIAKAMVLVMIILAIALIILIPRPFEPRAG